jgi:flavorubredoxin
MGILDIDDLEIFENVAYIMAWHADPSIPGTIDEWLEDFEMFSIYEILPEILKLWGDNLITQVDVKKNRQRAVGK